MDLCPFIVSEGVAASSRAVWVCLKHPAWGKVGFVGVYGPNDPANRALLWTKLANSLDTSFNWLFVGDFNMIESPSNVIGGDGLILRGREARAWTNMVRKFNLVDLFEHTPGQLRLG